MSNYSLFSVVGIEIEYMLVDRTTLAVRPISDLILQELAGEQVDDVELGDIAISNELVLHVLELKNNGPKAFDQPIAAHFQEAITKLQPLLEKHHLQFLPTGAHPWMDPHTETMRWPHGNRDIYKQYDRIFNCQGHGWANLQSMHVNLPFANDTEFCQLHNTIRLLLPLLPAIAASTPILEGKPTGLLDARLSFYAKNQEKIPSISGQVIPEFIRSQAEYEDVILQPMYRDISHLDPDKILQYEWLNSRGAIAKFGYMAVEIRIIDSQECVNADIAIARASAAILKHWTEQSHFHLDTICETERLKAIYDQVLYKGLDVVVEDKKVLQQWQLPAQPLTVRQIWSLLLERVAGDLDSVSQRALEHILTHGNLSERILRASGLHPTRDSLTHVYRQLGDCLVNNQSYLPS